MGAGITAVPIPPVSLAQRPAGLGGDSCSGEVQCRRKDWLPKPTYPVQIVISVVFFFLSYLRYLPPGLSRLKDRVCRTRPCIPFFKGALVCF